LKTPGERKRRGKRRSPSKRKIMVGAKKRKITLWGECRRELASKENKGNEREKRRASESFKAGRNIWKNGARGWAARTSEKWGPTKGVEETTRAAGRNKNLEREKGETWRP